MTKTNELSRCLNKSPYLPDFIIGKLHIFNIHFSPFKSRYFPDSSLPLKLCVILIDHNNSVKKTCNYEEAAEMSCHSSFRLLCNKIPHGWLINSRHLFLTALDARKSKAEALADLVSHESSLSRQHLFTVSSHCRRHKLALWSLFSKDIIPIMRALPSWPNRLPKAWRPNTITLGARISIY